MTCEKAGDYLSAYLDDMLDPQLRQEIEAHLDSCAHCREVLAEYRRFDELLASVPRMAPPAELHDRIFQSPEVAALIRAQGGRTSVPLLDRPAAAGEEPSAGSDPVPLRVRGSSPPWKRVALQSAAVLALLLGSALLIKQGLLRSSTTTGQGSVLTIAGPHDKAPLSAGTRAVYERGGALWSVPETGPELAKQLTPANATVSGWAVSPNGSLIAYTDGAGRIHVIRSDDQSDHVIGRVSPTALPAGFWNTPAGRGIAHGIAWSPDGGSIAYVAVDSSGGASLHIMSSDGAKDRVVSVGNAGTITTPIWNANGSLVAFVESVSGSQRLVVYSSAAGQAQVLATQADSSDSAARFTHLAWIPGDSASAVTWAASDGNTITGVFSLAATGGDATRLTPSGAHYTAADFSARGSGEWVVGADDAAGTLSFVVPGTSGATASIATEVGPIANVEWSPDVNTVAYRTRSGGLGLWSSGSAPILVASNVSSPPVWSRDGSRFAVQVSDGVLSVRVANGQPTVLSRLVTAPGAVSLLWAPDGQGLVVSGASGVIIASSDGHVKIADSQPAEDASIAWTVAR